MQLTGPARYAVFTNRPVRPPHHSLFLLSGRWCFREETDSVNEADYLSQPDSELRCTTAHRQQPHRYSGYWTNFLIGCRIRGRVYWSMVHPFLSCVSRHTSVRRVAHIEDAGQQNTRPAALDNVVQEGNYCMVAIRLRTLLCGIACAALHTA